MTWSSKQHFNPEDLQILDRELVAMGTLMKQSKQFQKHSGFTTNMTLDEWIQTGITIDTLRNILINLERG